MTKSQEAREKGTEEVSAPAVPGGSFQATGQGGEPGGLAELGMLRIGDTQAATVCKMENQREACCT